MEGLTAGYGKSTLLAEWITAYQGRAAWLSLDDRDNNPLRFWTYFTSALQTLPDPPGRTALQMLESAPNYDPLLFSHRPGK